jgi:secretion/DNA translocation related TadE-like protein
VSVPASYERGSGTVLVVALVGAVVCLVAALAVPLQLVVQQARLQASVDQAAIDANHALRGLITGYPCNVAKTVLHINMATTGKCSIVGEVTRVDASVNVAGIVLTATAWAGP